jgi:hypothetical protein
MQYTALPLGEMAQQKLQTQLLVTFGELLLDGPLFQFVRQVKDASDHLSQLRHLPHRPLDFPALPSQELHSLSALELLIEEP